MQIRKQMKIKTFKMQLRADTALRTYRWVSRHKFRLGFAEQPIRPRFSEADW